MNSHGYGLDNGTSSRWYPRRSVSRSNQQVLFYQKLAIHQELYRYENSFSHYRRVQTQRRTLLGLWIESIIRYTCSAARRDILQKSVNPILMDYCRGAAYHIFLFEKESVIDKKDVEFDEKAVTTTNGDKRMVLELDISNENAIIEQYSKSYASNKHLFMLHPPGQFQWMKKKVVEDAICHLTVQQTNTHMML